MCDHKETDVIVIAMKCRNAECGKVIQHRPSTDEMRFASAVRMVMQGLLDADSACSDFSEAERKILLSITPCRHKHRVGYECECSGNHRERCTDCNRVFADPSQWILGG
ncbi:MAG: hypothetical protein ACYC27_18750 [Armatimonadota bacterium]